MMKAKSELLYTVWGWICFIILSLTLMTPTSLQAQDEYNRIYAGNKQLLNISWSNDSRSLTFQELFVVDGGLSDIGVQSEQFNSWNEYDVETGHLTMSSLWPQPRILPQGLPIGQFQAPAANSFTFISPDGRYLAYLAVRLEGDQSACSPFGLANLETYSGIYVEGIRVCAGVNFNRNSEVVWSDDGSAFTVNTANSAETAFYITGYAENIENTTSVVLSTLDMNGEPLYNGRVFDLNTDGSRVLMNIDVTTEDGIRERLFIWDAVTPSESFTLIQDSYPAAGATFASDGENVWYIHRDGLMQYNLNTGETTVLDTGINSTWVQDAWFSPDGRYVALRGSGELSMSDALYVVEVPTGTD